MPTGVAALKNGLNNVTDEYSIMHPSNDETAHEKPNFNVIHAFITAHVNKRPLHDTAQSLEFCVRMFRPRVYIYRGMVVNSTCNQYLDRASEQ